jgi:uncharacterized protein involved in exopolysaccharide biosynthesis
MLDRPSIDLIDPAAEGVTFDDILAIVLRRWVVVILAAVAAAIPVAIMGMAGGRVYEASAVMSAGPSKIGDNQGGISTASFRPMIVNNGLARKVIAAFHLGDPPQSLTPYRFLHDRLIVTETRNTNLMQIAVRMPDPELAANVANAVATGAIELAASVSAQEAIRARDMIGKQMEEVGKRMTTAETNLLTFKRDAQIELLRGDVEAMLGERKGLTALLIKIESERAKLDRARQELKTRQPVDTVRKTIDADPTLTEAARAAQPAGTSILGLEMKSEAMNPVYQDIDKEIAISQANLAALEKQRAQIVDVRKLNGAALEKLTTLYQKESTLARLTLERDSAQKTFVDLSGQYEATRLRIAARSGELQLIDAAIPPESPLARGLLQRTAAAAVFGGACGALLVVVLHFTRRSRRRA